jgi:hypothetical protein
MAFLLLLFEAPTQITCPFVFAPLKLIAQWCPFICLNFIVDLYLLRSRMIFFNYLL